MVSNATIFTTSPILWLCAWAVLSLAAVILLARRRPSLVGSTLVAVWWWTLFSLLAVSLATGIVEVFVGQQAFASARILYAAAATTFCPLVAQLGAKRPQDRAWQFVVMSFLVVLLVPVGESLLYHPRSRFEVHAAWGWFVWMLIGLGFFNAVGTGAWIAASLRCAGQVLLLAPRLPVATMYFDTAYPLIALASLVASLAIRGLGRHHPTSVSAWDRVWLDFRDAFGTLWALRVADRFNVAAAASNWNVRLGWSGFVRPDAQLSDELLPPAAQTSLLGLLRRFVSRQWIETRLRCRIG